MRNLGGGLHVFSHLVPLKNLLAVMVDAVWSSAQKQIFGRTGLIEKHHAATLSRAQHTREQADYGVMVRIAHDDAVETLTASEEFVNVVRDFFSNS